MTETLAQNNPDFQVTTFESQTSDEQVLAVLRAKMITNFSWIFLSAILLLAPVVVLPLSLSFGLGNLLPANSQVAVIGFLVVWYLLIFAFTFQSFLTWYFNLYIITNKRIIDTDFLPLFYQKISSCELTQVEDITVSISGFVQSTFNYGNIQIQTAGEKDEFEFVKVSNPEAVQRLIEQAIDQGNGNRAA